MDDGADYQPPLSGAGRPLTQSERSVCYDQETYQDDIQERDEFFNLQIVIDQQNNMPLTDLVIDGAHGTAQVRITGWFYVDDIGMREQTINKRSFKFMNRKLVCTKSMLFSLTMS